MKKIHSDTSTYEEFVQAMEQDNACFDHCTYKNKIIYSSKFICQTPDFLTNIGFRNRMVYDAKHLMDHMHARSEEHEHGHWGTSEELLALPNMLCHPIAIISDKERVASNGDAYRNVEFLCIQQDNSGKNTYYMVAVQPRDNHIGMLEQYKAARVVTFTNIRDGEFYEKLNTAFCNFKNPGSMITRHGVSHELLYFDSKQRCILDQKLVAPGLLKQEPIAMSVLPHSFQCVNADRDVAETKGKIADAIYLELEREFENKIDSQRTQLPLLVESFKEINDRKSQNMSDIAIARDVICKTCEKSRDSLAQKAVLKAEKRFAEMYIQYMANGGKEQIVNEAVQAIAQVDALDWNDIGSMYDMIDKIEGDAIVQFSELAQSDACVRAAVLLNQDLVRELRDQLGEIARQKENTVQYLEERREEIDRCID